MSKFETISLDSLLDLARLIRTGKPEPMELLEQALWLSGCAVHTFGNKLDIGNLLKATSKSESESTHEALAEAIEDIVALSRRVQTAEASPKAVSGDIVFDRAEERQPVPPENHPAISGIDPAMVISILAMLMKLIAFLRK